MLTYETIADLSQPFVKLMNVGEQIIVNNVHGYLQVNICPNSYTVVTLFNPSFHFIVSFSFLFNELTYTTTHHIFRQGT
jgi:hypothetical protein